MSKAILSHLAAVQYGTIYNFYGRHSKTLKGSLVWATRKFAEMEKAGLIRNIPTVEYGTPMRYNTFYYCTPKGAKLVDMGDDYKYREPRTKHNAEHESAKIDIALSFILGYPDLIPTFEYDRTLYTEKGKPYTPDIIVTLKTPDFSKAYQFIVEIERFREPSRVKSEKIDLIETLKPWQHYRLSFYTKALIVYTHRSFNPFWRPQQYDPTSPDAPQDISKRTALVNENLKTLIRLSASLPEGKYFFLPFHAFPRLHERIWLTSEGHRVSLINQ
jgi:hypothetical protein